MPREAHVPFLLWLPAAVLAHAIGGGGANHAAQVITGRMDLLAFSRSVRQEVSREFRTTDVQFVTDEPQPETDEPSQQPDEDEIPDEEPDEPEKPKKIAQNKPPPMVRPPLPPPPKPKPKPKLPKPEPKAPPPKPKVPEPKKLAKKEPPPKPKKEPPKPKKAPPKPKKLAEKKQAPKPKKADAKPKPKLELPKPDGRIAVINDPSVKKDQKDNPNARRIADHANHVKEETMARFRSYDQNVSRPTGGGNPHDVDLPNPGNSPDERRGHSVVNNDEGPPRPGSQNGPEKIPDKPAARSPDGSNKPPSGQKAVAAQAKVDARAAGKGQVMPETVSGPSGAWSISPDGGDGRKKQRARAGKLGRMGRMGIPGVPIPGRLPAKYTVSAYGLVQALGQKQLRQEQEKARNTRLARHRGRFKGTDFRKYRAAIENYDPSVKLGNQTALNAARVPFASYVNRMHNRIHPIFADGFLGSLDKIGDPKLNNMALHTHMEIVISAETGKIVRAGIVKPSGVTAFDVGALSSLRSAGPFGQAPEAIVSPDGNVYMHWEFYRNPYYACTSKFARPYILKGLKKAPGKVTPPKSPPQPKAER